MQSCSKSVILFHSLLVFLLLVAWNTRKLGMSQSIWGRGFSCLERPFHKELTLTPEWSSFQSQPNKGEVFQFLYFWRFLDLNPHLLVLNIQSMCLIHLRVFCISCSEWHIIRGESQPQIPGLTHWGSILFPILVWYILFFSPPSSIFRMHEFSPRFSSYSHESLVQIIWSTLLEVEMPSIIFLITLILFKYRLWSLTLNIWSLIHFKFVL